MVKCRLVYEVWNLFQIGTARKTDERQGQKGNGSRNDRAVHRVGQDKRCFFKDRDEITFIGQKQGISVKQFGCGGDRNDSSEQLPRCRSQCACKYLYLHGLTDDVPAAPVL